MGILEVSGVTKTFGDLKAVDEVSFSLEAGDIYGFIGPNGAGKTTTMRVISTLDLPDSGDVTVNGFSVLEDPRSVRSKLGFMPDSYGSYQAVTIADYLDFFARAYGLRGDGRRRAVGQVMDFTSLEPMSGKLTSSLSKGMKQRLCLAKTLLHDPEVLILDEPASGLDPRARVEFRELVIALAEMKKAILVSSHILTELSEICTGVAIIEQGRIQASGSVEEVMSKGASLREVFIRCLADQEKVQRFIAEQPLHVESASRSRDGVTVQFAGSDDDLAALVADLVRQGLRPMEVRSRSTDLESLFMDLTEGRVQ